MRRFLKRVAMAVVVGAFVFIIIGYFATAFVLAMGDPL